MNEAHYFDMISRTVGEQLPDCVFYDYDEKIGYRLEFFGNYEDLCNMPLRLDIVINDCILVGDARQIEIRKNHVEYEAEYHAYAIHIFDGKIPG